MPKLKIDPKTIKEIPGYLDLAKLKVIYEDGEFIKWIDEKGWTNISHEPAKYQPKIIKKDQTGFVQVEQGTRIVYEWPDESSKEVDTISGSMIVKILEEYKYFIKINTPRMIQGWVKRDELLDYAVKKMVQLPGATTKERQTPDGNSALDIYSKDGALTGTIPRYTKVKYTASSIQDIAKSHGSLIKDGYTTDLSYGAVRNDPIANYYVTPLECRNIDNYAYAISEGVVIPNSWRRTITRIYDMYGKTIIETYGTFRVIATAVDKGDIYIAVANEYVTANEYNNESPDVRVEDIKYYRNGVLIFSRRWDNANSIEFNNDNIALLYPSIYTKIDINMKRVELFDIRQCLTLYQYIFDSKKYGYGFIQTNDMIWMMRRDKNVRARNSTEMISPIYDIKTQRVISK